MSWNATVDRLRARAQHDALASDEYTRRLLYEAVDEITRMATERGEAERTLATMKDELPRLRSKVLRLERDLARRVPNQDDLREVLDVVRWVSDPDSRPGQAATRVRATMEES